jgi:hypothetical protein
MNDRMYSTRNLCSMEPFHQDPFVIRSASPYHDAEPLFIVRMNLLFHDHVYNQQRDY